MKKIIKIFFYQFLDYYTPILSWNVDLDDFLVKNYCIFNCKYDLNKLEHYFKILLSDKKLYHEFALKEFKL